MKRIAIFAAAAVSVIATVSVPPRSASAEEGMWTFDNFPATVVGERYGFAPTQAWLDQVRLGSARFGRGCSSSFVSADGLVLTNHHCAHGCISQVSSAKHDYVAGGFIAAKLGDELRCPHLEVSQLVEIRDVTSRMSTATDGLSGKAYNEAQNAEMSRIEKECTSGDDVRCDVVALYHGGRYHLYKYKRFHDVRLVFAPEIAAAFFGGDPDNFSFPRYDLDVTFVRVYEHAKPARTEHYLPISPTGAKDGELVFVSGHPGSTSRLVPLAQLEFDRDVAQPFRLLYYAELRGILTQFQRESAERKRISTASLYGVENGFKGLKGRFGALHDDAFMARRREEEGRLRAKFAATPALAATAGGAWETWTAALRRYEPIYVRHRLLENGSGFSSELFDIARHLVRAAEELEKPDDKRLREYTQAKLASLERQLFSTAPLYDDLEVTKLAYGLTILRRELGPDDPLVRKVLGERSPEELAAWLVKATKLKDVETRRALYRGGHKAFATSSDPFIALARSIDPEARALRKIYEDEIEAPIKQAGEAIARAQFALFGTSTYPDATGTLRLSYGQVKGWTEPDGRVVAPITTLGGAFERHTGREPFRLPARWLAAKSKLDATTPFNVVTTHDIIGGNSGSPLLNQRGEVVGVVFDSNLHGLGGDFGYEPTRNRTVAVHSAGLLEALAKVYGAERLVGELRTAASARSAAAR